MTDAQQAGANIAFWLLLALGFAGLWLHGKYTRRKLTPVEDGPADAPYAVYTREFDVELRADQIPAKLRDISPDWTKGYQQRDNELWDHWWDQSGQLFAKLKADEFSIRAKLAGIIGAAEASEPVFVTLLVDQSGSMKGEPIWHTAAVVKLLSGILAELGAGVEVLGFSTAGWHGGYPGQRWRAARRPKYPGRTCALLHIIYAATEDRGLSPEAWRAMLHPDILRENVDGEALLWAAGRMRALPEGRKYLVILSDGASVDDLTLYNNGPSYLERHLETVIGELQRADDIVLGAVGLGVAVDHYYEISAKAESLEEIHLALADVMEQMSRAGREQ